MPMDDSTNNSQIDTIDFSSMPDNPIKYCPAEVLITTYLAFMCGIQDLDDIKKWAENNLDKLKSFLKLDNGIHDSIIAKRLIRYISGNDILLSFTNFCKQARVHFTYDSFDDYYDDDDDERELQITPLCYNYSQAYVVKALFPNDHRIIYGGTTPPIKEYTDSIIARNVDLFNLTDAIIFCDKFGILPIISVIIKHNKGDYCITLNEDEDKDKYEYAKAIFSDVAQKSLKCENFDIHTDDGRIDNCMCCIFDNSDTLSDDLNALKVKAIGMFQREIVINNSKDIRTFYHVLSFNDIEKYATVLKNHYSLKTDFAYFYDIFFFNDEKTMDEKFEDNLGWFSKLTEEHIKDLSGRSHSYTKEEIQKRASNDFQFLLRLFRGHV